VAGSSLDVQDGARESHYPFEGMVVDVNWGWAVALITAAESRNAPLSTTEFAAATKVPVGSAVLASHIQLPTATALALASGPALSPWKQRLAAGANQSLAIKADGTLWGWGLNNVGQLCDGTTTQQSTAVQSAITTGVTQVATSTLSSGGANPHTLAVASDRSVWGCGDNSYGELGVGDRNPRTTPVQTSGLTGILSVGTGQYHSIALKSDGTVWGWGNNGNGEVGDGSNTQRLSPVQVHSLTGVVAISAGYEHNMALKSDGTVWTWGYNGWGQLGNGNTTDSPTPIPVPNLTGVVAIAAGEDHSVVLKNDGTVWSWGDGHLGQLGEGNLGFILNPPAQVMGLANVIAIAAGDYHTLAVKSDGTVWTWGLNTSGQLGNSSATNSCTLPLQCSDVPVQVSGLTGVLAVAGGANHSLALKSDGTIWAWGDNTNGQLGNGGITASMTPVMGPSGFAPVPSPPPALRFISATAPCRVADTRNPAGPFGGPSITGGASRSFVIPSSACGIPSTAAAYALNVTVVPNGPLGYLTLYPTGLPLPVASTLNSLDGRVKANAAIVPAGTSGAVSVYVTSTTDVILDITGYFVPSSNTAALAFFPLSPCRVADSRSSSGPLGGPFLAARQTRPFPILSSTCNVPSTALAYSLNFTAIPHGTLGYITTWATGGSQPPVSTLNAIGGQITANAAIVPSGTAGQIDVFTTDDTDLVIDINGYFAPAGAGGLSLYSLAPCRVLDTRNPLGSPPFSGTQDASVVGSLCGVNPSAEAYVLSATVVPPGLLGYISLWPQGQPQPVVSTLNALDGAITSNMAIVPTTNGLVSEFASQPTQLILDISGYFAP
jgi:alpha-tubulin suppressor-like RCC1 family protein